MPSFSPTDARPILISPAAIEALRTELEETDGEFIRVTMHPAEVLSPRYAIDSEDELQPGDVVMDFDGLTAVVSADSADRLRGTVIDLVECSDDFGFKFCKPEE